ncbi:hypothetical protein GCM10027160_26290 [Streptomyces calidiresistens]|uniref:ATP synthase protein I n=1 Tax=Streptomyces calidiresistens TaxID=1485586 RepID=A0A7W3T674_9ACTN|nr:hypothetical protein [Streptomyces calidiresistens]MBB0231674.1 hypothetical protein [Streptomyces calidiresistens]
MQPNDARIIRGAALFTAAAGALAILVGALAAGGAGALGVFLGVLVGFLFFASGQFGLARVGHRWPELFMAAALVIYITQVGVLLVLMILLRDATFLNGPAFGAGVLVAMFAWIIGQIRTNLKVKTPYVVPTADSSTDAPAGAGAPGREAGE